MPSVEDAQGSARAGSKARTTQPVVALLKLSGDHRHLRRAERTLGIVDQLPAGHLGASPRAIDHGLPGLLSDRRSRYIEQQGELLGTLAERIRAGGAGIPAFFTKTGVGTLVAEGKEVREFDGELYVMERGLTADLSIVTAWKGDAAGNLIYRKTARNFNPMMATAAKFVAAEVEVLVDTGDLDKDSIHTPGIYIDRLVGGAAYERRIEQLTTRKREDA